jgi:hypothetical protein
LHVPQLVFNLEKVGISDGDDRKTRKVVFWAAMRGVTIHCGRSRNDKHISVIVCIFATRKSLIPYIIASQGQIPERTLHNQVIVQGKFS